MSAVLSPPTKLSPYLYLLEWTGIPPFRVFDYYNYKYLERSTTNTQLLVVSPYANQCPAIQVADAEDAAVDGETYPGLARVQWRGQKDMVRYEVDNGFSILNSTPETGAGYYEYVFTHNMISYLENIGVYLTAYDSEGNSKITPQIPLSLSTIRSMYNWAPTYDSGTNTITVGFA
jgi:hypothetical protein